MESRVVHNYRVPLAGRKQFQKPFEPLLEKLPLRRVPVTAQGQMPPIAQRAYNVQPLGPLAAFDVLYLLAPWRAAVFPLPAGLCPAFVNVHTLFYRDTG